MPVPWLGKVMAKTDRDDAVLLGKHTDLRIPVPIVVQRTMNQDERYSASALAICYGISVDFDSLDTFWQRPTALHCHERPHELAPARNGYVSARCRPCATGKRRVVR